MDAGFAKAKITPPLGTRMVAESGDEVQSYYEYRFSAPLTPGYESVFKQGLAGVGQRYAL